MVEVKIKQESDAMVIGERLKTLREEKKLSQGDIEKRTGLLRCYISRVENGHTVPAIETLEKMARAMEVQLYELFIADGQQVKPGARSISSEADRTLGNLGRQIAKMSKGDRKLLIQFASNLARRSA
jgi:transcriptional regulator with XRE-family HTH domain